MNFWLMAAAVSAGRANKERQERDKAVSMLSETQRAEYDAYIENKRIDDNKTGALIFVACLVLCAVFALIVISTN